MSNVNYALMMTAERQAEIESSRLLQQLAILRSRKETSGVMITPDVCIHSDRSTRVELASLFINFQNGLLDAPVTWKAQTGWILLDLDMLRQVLWVVNAHVQACFTTEKLLSEQIESGELTEGETLEAHFDTTFKLVRKKAVAH